MKKKRTKIFSDFKQFIFRGNIVDLAVAVIIGAAFGKIVTSLVNDIIMPLISLALGGFDFAGLKTVIRHANEVENITEVAVYWGSFIQTIIDFLIIAVCIFLVIRIMTNLQRNLKKIADKVGSKDCEDEVNAAIESVQAQPAASSTQKTEELLVEIRDLLKASKE